MFSPQSERIVPEWSKIN